MQLYLCVQQSSLHQKSDGLLFNFNTQSNSPVLNNERQRSNSGTNASLLNQLTQTQLMAVSQVAIQHLLQHRHQQQQLQHQNQLHLQLLLKLQLNQALVNHPAVSTMLAAGSNQLRGFSGQASLDNHQMNAIMTSSIPKLVTAHIQPAGSILPNINVESHVRDLWSQIIRNGLAENNPCSSQSSSSTQQGSNEREQVNIKKDELNRGQNAEVNVQAQESSLSPPEIQSSSAVKLSCKRSTSSKDIPAPCSDDSDRGSRLVSCTARKMPPDHNKHVRTV